MHWICIIFTHSSQPNSPFTLFSSPVCLLHTYITDPWGLLAQVTTPHGQLSRLGLSDQQKICHHCESLWCLREDTQWVDRFRHIVRSVPLQDDMMFRCFLRPGGRPHIAPTWLPSLASCGSRGVKMSKTASHYKSSVDLAKVGLSMSGRQWLDRLAKSGIRRHNEYTFTQTLKPVLTIKTAPWHVRKFYDDVYFTDMGHASTEVVVRRYLRQHKERPLWCHATSYASDSAIVRGKFKYRARAALNQALRDAGYDNEGRWIGEGKGRGQVGPTSELFGTIHISTSSPKEIQTIPFTKLRGFFDEVVRMLEQKLGQTAADRNTSSDSEVPRAQVQRSQHQASHNYTKATARPVPGNRGSHVSRRGTPHGRGEGGRGQWKSGDSDRPQNRHSRASQKQPINEGF